MTRSTPTPQDGRSGRPVPLNPPVFSDSAAVVSGRPGRLTGERGRSAVSGGLARLDGPLPLVPHGDEENEDRRAEQCGRREHKVRHGNASSPIGAANKPAKNKGGSSAGVAVLLTA